VCVREYMQLSRDNWHRVTSRFDYSIMQMQSKTTVVCRIIVILRNITDVDRKIRDRIDDGTPAGGFLVSLRDTAGFLDASIARMSHGRVLPTARMCACIISTERGWLSNVLYRRGKSRSIRDYSSPHADELCKSRKTGPRAARGIIALSRWVFNRF